MVDVCLPVAVVVAVLLVVEAAVLEGLVPFLVPVTNSICETHRILDLIYFPGTV